MSFPGAREKSGQREVGPGKARVVVSCLPVGTEGGAEGAEAAAGAQQAVLVSGVLRPKR